MCAGASESCSTADAEAKTDRHEREPGGSSIGEESGNESTVSDGGSDVSGKASVKSRCKWVGFEKGSRETDCGVEKGSSLSVCYK